MAIIRGIVGAGAGILIGTGLITICKSLPLEIAASGSLTIGVFVGFLAGLSAR